MLIQTNFGAVSIKNIEIVTDHQQYLGATMYIPKIASAENKCPVVVTSSGWEDAGETWSYVAESLSLIWNPIVMAAQRCFIRQEKWLCIQICIQRAWA